VVDSEVPLTNLLRCNHHWPFRPALTLTRRLTLTSLTLISLIMRSLTISFPATRQASLTFFVPNGPWCTFLRRRFASVAQALMMANAGSTRDMSSGSFPVRLSAHSAGSPEPAGAVG
jgi:hypothetical protein